MQKDIRQSQAAKGIEQFFADCEFRLLWLGHMWPVGEYGPCPPRPDWWTEKDEQGWHKQGEPITEMLSRSRKSKQGVTL